MERTYLTAKSQLVHFRLENCCWFAPVRVGLMIIGYFNIVADVVCLLGIANDGFSPTITRVQEILIEDFVNKPIPIMAYAIELGFSVVLLCAIHRRDLVLLRVFMYYTMLAVVMSFLVYSIVIIAVPLQIQLAIVFSTLFQIYIVILVRSVMVEMKIEKKQYELPRLVLSRQGQEKTTPGTFIVKNKELQEVKVTEVPKRQDVVVTVVGKSQDDKIKTDIEVKKDVDVKDKGAKQEAVVTVEVEPKKSKDEKKKDEKKLTKEEKKLSKEAKKLSKEEKKLSKEEKKSGKEEKTNKDEKESKDDEKKELEEIAQTKDTESKDSKKNVKETWLKTVTEHPKE